VSNQKVSSDGGSDIQFDPHSGVVDVLRHWCRSQAWQTSDFFQTQTSIDSNEFRHFGSSPKFAIGLDLDLP
jgi:hypothetical protein